MNLYMYTLFVKFLKIKLSSIKTKTMSIAI